MFDHVIVSRRMRLIINNEFFKFMTMTTGPIHLFRRHSHKLSPCRAIIGDGIRRCWTLSKITRTCSSEPTSPKKQEGQGTGQHQDDNPSWGGVVVTRILISCYCSVGCGFPQCIHEAQKGVVEVNPTQNRLGLIPNPARNWSRWASRVQNIDLQEPQSA